jgi:serine/threonine protein kinase/Tol biopolymer transport system component
MIGRTLGHYEITLPLGKGGMGEVYQAKDLKLGRDVAIKVLPQEFARDADRVARFQREAKLLASLNHPNIAAIYGLEESTGTHFLVLELIEGDTLADQIKHGPIPAEDSLKLALQIAEALEAAHEKGVIHRDLKPANIKITPDGKVKVLDFGLAKAFGGDQENLNLSNSPTLSDMATLQGVILGTAAYMSPEQARGKTVDKRTDIWAFGCVLYEMLSGKAAFQGEDVTEILAAVVKSGVNLDLLPTNLHSRIRLLLERCLEKDPKNRYHDIADARVDIQKVLADPSGVFAQPSVISRPRERLLAGIPWVAVVAIIGFIFAGVAAWYLKPSEPHPITRLSHVLPIDQQMREIFGVSIAVSPDGRRFVYCTSEGLWLRSMDKMDATHLLGAGEGALRWPFFSPDGKWIGFYSGMERKLKKIAINGGIPVPIADVTNNGWFNWEADETIVYGQAGRGIMRVSADGGNPELIVKAADKEVLINPQVLPDGKSILVTRIIPRPSKTFVLSLKLGERKELFDGTDARYLPTGHIVYAFGSNLFAIRFNLSALRVVGGAVSFPESVYSGHPPQYGVSDSGTLVYIPATNNAGGTPMSSLEWVDKSGKEEPIQAESRNFFEARISPEGTKVALSILDEGSIGIWIWDFARKTLSPITKDSAFCPLWSVDGRRIVFASYRQGNTGIYWKAADGSGRDELIYLLPGSVIIPNAWSKDGKILVVTETDRESAGIGTLFMEGKNQYKRMLKESYNIIQPRISPDGQWIAYTSNESGRNEVYVSTFPDVDKGRQLVSTDGGDSPLWSRDGEELFYHNADEILAVPVKAEPTFSLEPSKLLFRGTYSFSNLGVNAVSRYPTRWDVSRDGRHFLMIKPPGITSNDVNGPRQIDIVLNWLEELKQRVPEK